jgi:hypothetical protein
VIWVTKNDSRWDFERERERVLEIEGRWFLERERGREREREREREWFSGELKGRETALV